MKEKRKRLRRKRKRRCNLDRRMNLFGSQSKLFKHFAPDLRKGERRKGERRKKDHRKTIFYYTNINKKK